MTHLISESVNLPETLARTVTAKTKPITLKAIGNMSLPVQAAVSAKNGGVGAKQSREPCLWLLT